MKLLLSLTMACASVFAADLACESNNSASATYSWNDPTGWNCYASGKVRVANEFPGKNYPANRYIVILGLSTNSNVVTEHDMNVDATLGVLGKPYAQFAITAVANNGSGAIRVTTGVNTVATGDKLYCYAASGAGADSLYGVWTATSIDTSNFDLQGSTFGSSAVTTGRCEFPAALKRQGLSTGATTVGKWWAKPGTTLTARGDLIDTWAYGTRVSRAEDPTNTTAFIRCGDSTLGGCTINFDASTANVYGTHGPVASPLRNMQFILRGTPAAHARIAAVGSGYATLGGALASQVSNDMYGDYVDFVNLGRPVGAIQSIFFQHEAASTFRLSHFTFQSAGYVSFTGTTPDPALGGTWLMSFGTFDAASCSSAFTCMYGLKGPTAAPYVIGPGVAFLPQYNPVSSNQAIGKLVFDGDYFSIPPNLGTSALSTEVDSEVKNSIIVRIPSQVGQEQPLGIEKVTGNFFWLPHDPSGGGNSHMLYVPGHNKLTKMDVSGNVFQHQSDSLDAVGNMFDENTTIAFASPTYITYHDNLTLPDVDYVGAMGNWRSNNSMAVITSATNFKWKVYNNTFFGTSDGHGFVLGHNTSLAPAGKLEEYRCNAITRSQIYPNIAGAAQVIVGTGASASGSPTDTAVPSGIHHNAAFGWSTVRSTDSSFTNTIGTRYGFAASAVPAGIADGTDQYFDDRVPTVVDYTRRMLTWANQKYSQSFATETDVLAYLLADSSRLQDIPDLVAWVKAGWTLNEPTLYAACSDGTNIGAAVAGPSGPPGITDPTDTVLKAGKTFQFHANCPAGHSCRFETLAGHDATSSVTTGGLYTAPATPPPAHGSVGGCPTGAHNSVFNMPVTSLPLDPHSADMMTTVAGITAALGATAPTGVYISPVRADTPTSFLQPYYDVGFKWTGNYPFRTPPFLAPYLQGVTGATGSRDYPKSMVQTGWRVNNIDNRWMGVDKACTVYEYYISGAFENGYHDSTHPPAPNNGLWSNVGNISVYPSMTFQTPLGLKGSTQTAIAAGMWLAPMQIDGNDLLRSVDANGANANLKHRIAMTFANQAIVPQSTNIHYWPALAWAGGCVYSPSPNVFYACTAGPTPQPATNFVPYGAVLRLKQSFIDSFDWAGAAAYLTANAKAFPGMNVTRALNTIRGIFNTMRDYGVEQMDGTSNSSMGGMHARNPAHYDPDYSAASNVLTQAKGHNWGWVFSNTACGGGSCMEVVDESAWKISDSTYAVRAASVAPFETVAYRDLTANTILDTRDIAILPATVGATQLDYPVIAGAGPVDLTEDLSISGLPDSDVLDWTLTPSVGTLSAGRYTPPATLATPVIVKVRASSRAYPTAYTEFRLPVYPNVGSGLYIRNGFFTDLADTGRTWWGASSGAGLFPCTGSGSGVGYAFVGSAPDSVYPAGAYSTGSGAEQFCDFRVPVGNYKLTVLMMSAQSTTPFKSYITVNGNVVLPSTDTYVAAGSKFLGGMRFGPFDVPTTADGRLTLGHYTEGNFGAAPAYFSAFVLEPGSTSVNTVVVGKFTGTVH